MELRNFTDKELIELYSKLIKELKDRGVIRTKNVLGEIGERLVIEEYCSNPKLPNLQAAPISTENIDAISRKGDRYSIKSTSTKTTGVFYGLEPKGSINKDIQKFEFVVICVFDDNYELRSIYELNWDAFIKHKRWHSRMQAWNLVLTKEVISDARIIYQKKDKTY